MRKLSVLYSILLKLMVEYKSMGICFCIYDLHNNNIITYAECDALMEHFNLNKPRINGVHSEFANKESFTGMAWWWKFSEEGMEQRILFLKHLIKLEEAKEGGKKGWWERFMDRIWWV